MVEVFQNPIVVIYMYLAVSPCLSSAAWIPERIQNTGRA